MSQELFYTSAPRGLQPGSRGFCTVAMTRGMSPALMEKLEALSGYRPLYPPSDSRSSLNPVTYAHVKIGVGGKSYHVLSRIGAAGLDYTERANKFAHHVVLEADELPAAGPAWVLNQPGFMENRWNGAVQYLTEGRIPPRGDSQPEICRAWKEASGDPGWAGIVAEAFMHDSNQLVYVLFEPGLNLLPLIAEAVDLISPEQRWDVTFSTYFTGLSQGAICAWRCVPRDSVEANAARKIPNALIIDLGAPLGPARGGPLVAKARGQMGPPPVPEINTIWPKDKKPENESESFSVGKLIKGGWPNQGHFSRNPPGQLGIESGSSKKETFNEPSGPSNSSSTSLPPPFFAKPELNGIGWLGPVIGLGAGIFLALALVGGGFRIGIFRIVDKEEKTGNKPNNNPGPVVHNSKNDDPKRAKEQIEQLLVMMFQKDLEAITQLGEKNGLMEKLENEKQDKKEFLKRLIQDVEKVPPEAANIILAYADKFTQTEEEKKAITSLKSKKDKPVQVDVKTIAVSEAFTGIMEQIKKLKEESTGAFNGEEIDKKLRKWYEECFGVLEELNATQGSFGPRMARDYFTLPAGNITTEKKELLPPGMKKPMRDPNEKWHLRLEGLKTKISKDFEVKEVPKPFSLDLIVVEKTKDKPNKDKLLAQFSLLRDGERGENSKLIFQWKSDDKKDAEARRLVRNSLLVVKNENSQEEFYMGLMRIKEDLNHPYEFDLSKENQSIIHTRNSEDQVEKGLFLEFARCEVGNQIRELHAIKGRDTKELIWDQKFQITIEKKDDQPGKYLVKAKWIGAGKPQKVYVHALAAYTRINGQGVEVWRFEKK